LIRALDDFEVDAREDFLHRALELASLIAAVGVKFEKKWIESEQGRNDQGAAVAILNVGSVDDGVHQQALRIDENMPLLALDLLARVVARRIDRRSPFSALLTLWLSMIAAVGETSREACSRHLT